jgi:hypothetical protein
MWSAIHPREGDSMFTRPMLFLGVLAASIVVPYIALNEQLAETARGQWKRLTGGGHPADEDLGDTDRPLASIAAVGPPIEQALRFDLTPQWVATHWPHVTTIVGDAEELGMRVAWVSGTRPDDVAGSLTYYFDKHHQLVRITFTGLTAEPRRLLAAVVGPYGLKSQPTTNAAHYLSGEANDPTSEVIVNHLPVLVSSEAAPRAEISLVLGRRDARGGEHPRDRDPEKKLLPSAYRRW